MKPLTWAMGIGIAFAFSNAAYGQCEPRWSEQFQSPYLEGRIDSMVGYDPDGHGGSPARLVVGGQFEYVSSWWEVGDPLNGITTWDGVGWRALGKGLLSLRDHEGNLAGLVNALASLDEDGDGPKPPYLYAAGGVSLPGTTEQFIARWDGRQWEGMSRGELWGNPYWLAVVDEDGPGGAVPVLYAAGYLKVFRNLTPEHPSPYCGVARFDGAHWERVPGSVPEGVKSIASLDDDGNGPHPTALYVVTLVNYPPWPEPERYEITRWNGHELELVAVAPRFISYPPLLGLSYFDEDGPGPGESALFFCGNFTEIGGVPFPGIAKWNGHSWERVGAEGEVSGAATAMSLFDDDGDGPIPPALFVTGLTVAGTPFSSYGIARWDGRQWSSVGKDVNIFDAYSAERGMIAIVGDDGVGQHQLVVRGSIAANGLGEMVQWDGKEWSPMLGGGLASYFAPPGLAPPFSNCFEVCDSLSGESNRKDLVVGGWFLAAGNLITKSA
ncbi:MAG: hypothetical protein HZA51_03375 [Planctomycetes bacterium]|nr:hypothetical protein [Planctomycetota bacterium]